MDGLLVVNKPSGPTSHDVVARVRRVLRERRIGHTGTLDPTATGVLPLVIGRATRLARFLSGSDKVYEATVRLGFATDPGDAAGRPLSPPLAGAMPPRDTIDAALDAFRGTFIQQPPALSAKKIGGTRSYALARQASRQSVDRDRPDPAGAADDAGEGSAEAFAPPHPTLLPGRPDAPVLPAPVEVTAHAIEILECGPDTLRLRVRCTAGFYIRSLAHDLGERLGVGGHLTALCRTSTGDLTLEQSVTLGDLESGADGAATARARLVPLERMLPAFPECLLTLEGMRHASQGRELGPIHFSGSLPALLAGAEPAGNVRFRLVGPDGALVGVAERSSMPGLLHPAVVLV